MTRPKNLSSWLMVPWLLLVSVGIASAQVRLVDAVKAADKTAVRALLKDRKSVV